MIRNPAELELDGNESRRFCPYENTFYGEYV